MGDPEYPRRPVLVALSVPLVALLPFVGGALTSLSWMGLPGVALSLAGTIWLMWAVLALSPSVALRVVAMVLMFIPMLSTPLCAMRASRALVLQERGVSRPAVVVHIAVSHGRTTTYSCAVRYDGSAETAADPVSCGRYDRVGDRVRVVRDPGGLVDPEFGGAVDAARSDVALAVRWETALMAVSLSAVAVGAVIRRVTRRRAEVRAAGPLKGGP